MVLIWKDIHSELWVSLCVWGERLWLSYYVSGDVFSLKSETDRRADTEKDPQLSRSICIFIPKPSFA